MVKHALAVAMALAVVGTPTVAQQSLSGEAIKALVSGKNMDYGNDGTASYKADGRYEYFNKSNGATSRGKWVVQGDSLCVDFDNGQKRCDQFLKDANNRVLLKNSRGTTFPVTVR
jgi:hypothetical protein